MESELHRLCLRSFLAAKNDLGLDRDENYDHGLEIHPSEAAVLVCSRVEAFLKQINERVLILAGRKECKSFSALLSLSDEKIELQICENFQDLQKKICLGVGAVLVSKEALDHESITELSLLLKNQPAWSFLPVIVLMSSSTSEDLQNETTVKLIKSIRNVNILERPVRPNALLSVLQAVLADRKRQYKVRDLLVALENSKKEAILANEAKSAFLANISHEIRTPLGAILGFSELLVDDQGHERLQYVEKIRRNGELLRTLVDDILDLSSVESPHFETEVSTISLKELVSDVIEYYEPKTKAKSLGFQIHWSNQECDLVDTDPVRLKQILMNMVGNAVKFTQSGQISLSVRAQSTEAEKNKVILFFEVSDTGIGISPEQAAKLFKPFTQADSSFTRPFGGTGLGLVLSKKLALALRGDIILKKSTEGLGSTFEISVQAQIPLIANKVVSSYNELKPLDNLKILVVDDSKDNQFLISRLLKNSGAEVQTADDGQYGVEEALNQNYDLILMDVQMPRMSGLEATTQLREKNYNKPIIALTANALKGDREKCLQAGCDDYLTKPIQKQELISRVALLGQAAFHAV